MIQVYYGDGKGKTTAATGLFVRALGQEIKGVYCQFMKPGNAGEINFLTELNNRDIKIITPDIFYGFYKDMTPEQKSNMRDEYFRMLGEVKGIIEGESIGLLVLDEVLHGIHKGLIEEAVVIDIISSLNGEAEVVLTGRNPSDRILEMADYVTCFEKKKHPFDKGIKARKGIEF